MKSRSLLIITLVLLFALLALVPAAAHEGRQVGDYLIEFGWRLEPAYTTLLNGPEFTVVTHDDEKPVSGLDQSLRLEVQYGGRTKMLTLREVFDAPGQYTADLIPTQPGDYSFVLTGAIGDLEVNETFSSTQGEFSTVEPVSDIQFP